MGRAKPLNDLETVQRAVLKGNFQLTGRIRRWIGNHYDGEDPTDIVEDVLLSIREENFYKTDELKIRPGTFADIYHGVQSKEYCEWEWYVKFYLEEDGKVVVVLSCNGDGFIH